LYQLVDQPGSNWALDFDDFANSRPADHEIGDLACLRAHHEIINSAGRDILQATHGIAHQFVGPDHTILIADRFCGGDRLIAARYRPAVSTPPLGARGLKLGSVSWASARSEGQA
jgi:hypothetical protein